MRFNNSPLLTTVAFVVSLLLTLSTMTMTATFVRAGCDEEYRINGTTSPSDQFTVAQINAILKAHNDARRTVNPWAKVMPMLQWSQCLANLAKQYITTCPGMVHSSHAYRQNKCGYSYIGENLAAGSGTSYQNATGGVSSTNAWNSERTTKSWVHGCNAFNSSDTPSCYGAGHYTQVIWADTTHVGCASAYCPALAYKNYWQCVYGKGGNYNKGKTTYVKTAVASEAARCQKGLPTTTAAPTTTTSPKPKTRTLTREQSVTPLPPTTTTTTSPPTTTSAAPTTTTTTTSPPTTTSAAPPEKKPTRTLTKEQSVTPLPATTTTTTAAPSSPLPSPNITVDGFRLVAFIDPEHVSSWRAAIQHEKNNNIDTTLRHIIVRIAPHGGAGASVSTPLKNFLTEMRTNFSAVINVFAVIETNGRKKPLATVKSEIDTVRSQYGAAAVNGFYVDTVATTRGANTSSDIYNYDSAIASHIKQQQHKSSNLMFFNPRATLCASSSSSSNSDVSLAACLVFADYAVAFDGTFDEWAALSSSSSSSSASSQQKNDLLEIPRTTSKDKENHSRFAVFVRGAMNASAARTVIVTSVVDKTDMFNFTLAAITNSSSSSTAFSAPPPYWFPSAVRHAQQSKLLKQRANRRGCYIKLYSDKSGNMIFADNATWKDKFEHILTNATKREWLLDDLVSRGFNAVSLYDLGYILQNSAKRVLLREFLARARQRGIETVEFIGGTTQLRYQQIAQYQNESNGNASVMFDGILTEIEWWHSSSTTNVSTATNNLKYFMSLNPHRRFKDVPLTTNVYIGWATASDIDQLVEDGVTTIMTHGYRTTPDSIVSYMKTRINNELAASLNKTNLKNDDNKYLADLCITPIFAASGVEVRSGSESFMGDWMRDHSPHSIDKAEAIVTNDWNMTWPSAIGQHCGYQWFSDFYVRVYDRPAATTTTTTTTTTAAATTSLVPTTTGTIASTTQQQVTTTSTTGATTTIKKPTRTVTREQSVTPLAAPVTTSPATTTTTATTPLPTTETPRPSQQPQHTITQEMTGEAETTAATATTAAPVHSSTTAAGIATTGTATAAPSSTTAKSEMTTSTSEVVPQTTAKPTTTATSQQQQQTSTTKPAQSHHSATLEHSMTVVVEQQQSTSGAATSTTAAATTTTGAQTTMTTTGAPQTTITSKAPSATTTAATTTATATTTTAAPAKPIAKVRVVMKSSALKNQVSNSAVVTSVQDDLAKKFNVNPSQVKVSLRVVGNTNAQLVEVDATVTDISFSEAQSITTALNTTKSSAWMSNTFSTLRAAGEDPSSTVVMSASAVDASSSATTEAPSDNSPLDYCKENLPICVGPAVGGFVLIVLVVVILKRRKGANRAAVEAVQETDMAQSQNAWFQTGAESFGAAPGAHTFISSSPQQQSEMEMRFVDPTDDPSYSRPGLEIADDDLDAYLGDLQAATGDGNNEFGDL